jgi:glycosyltransferase involved in cell wall biosynthesis
MYYNVSIIVAIVCLVVTCIQLFYYLYFFARFAFYKQKQNNEPELSVSIIVCAYNEEANLRKNLPLLLQQQYKNEFEVLVVNDNSNDGSFYFLNEMKKQYPHLTILNLSQEAKHIVGKKFPLSMGIKQAKFDHVLLTDSDCTPTSNEWLHSMSSCFSEKKQIVLGYGPYIKYNTWLNKCIRFETVHAAIQYFSYALAKVPYMGVGRNLAYHRSLFNDNKGFSSHHHLISGDDDLFINEVATTKNVAIHVSNESFMYSEPKQTKQDWEKQKKRHLSTSKYYKPLHKFLLGTYSFSHALFWISLIVSLFFYQFVFIPIGCCLLRWLVQFIVFSRTMRKLREDDLIPYIWVFDIWLLYYNITHLPYLFIKNKTWK